MQQVLIRFIIGNFAKGFQVSLHITDGDQVISTSQGYLPANVTLWDCFKAWTAAYRGVQTSATRIIRDSIKTYAFSRAAIRQAAADLAVALQDWLGGEFFQGVEQHIAQHFAADDPFQIVIAAQDQVVRRLPWHLWPMFECYPHAAVNLSGLTQARSALKPLPQDPPTKQRVLAIIGQHQGIDLQADVAILEQESGWDIEFLYDPKRQTVKDYLWQQRWDILFFAGHAQVVNRKSQFFIRSTESLPLSELRHALRKAVQRGLQLAIFNTCDGLSLAQDLGGLAIPNLVVMREIVPDQVAQTFLRHFLRALTQHEPIHLAMRQAREQLQELETQFPCASWLPMLCQTRVDGMRLGVGSRRRWAVVAGAGLTAAGLVVGVLGSLEPSLESESLVATGPSFPMESWAEWQPGQVQDEDEDLEHITDPIVRNIPITIKLNKPQGHLKTHPVVSKPELGSGSLREANANATANDLKVNNPLGLGERVIISGGYTSRIFDIFTNDAESENIHLIDGFLGSKNGGAIRHLGRGELRIADSMISGSTAGGLGGAIHSISSVTLVDSTISNNSSSNGAGGVFGVKDITIINSEISQNTSMNAGGGIVGGTINVVNSTISKNSSAESGGGIASWGQAIITHSTIADNLSGKDGGGMAIAGNVTQTNTTVSGNSAVGSGGGFSVSSGTAQLTDTTVSHNQAGSDDGFDMLSEAAKVEITKTNTLNFTESIQFNDQNNASELFLSTNQVNIPNSLELDGVDLAIQANNSINTVELYSSSVTGGGDFYIVASNDIRLRNVITSGIQSDGGNVYIESLNGSVLNTNSDSTGAVETSSNGGNAGNVTISAATDITLGKIFAEGLGGSGGSVELASPGLIRIINAGPSFFNTNPASIAVAGTSAGGSIRIKHGGAGVTPFVVGDADVAMNGSADRITMGNGFEQTITPQQFFLHNHTQSSIQILSANAPPLTVSTPGSHLPLPPVSDPATTQRFAERIGEQVGAMTQIIGEGTENARVVWTIPGEAQPLSIPITLPLVDIPDFDIHIADDRQPQSHLTITDPTNSSEQPHNFNVSDDLAGMTDIPVLTPTTDTALTETLETTLHESRTQNANLQNQ